jgi:hypothetical protein
MAQTIPQTHTHTHNYHEYKLFQDAYLVQRWYNMKRMHDVISRWEIKY